MPQQNTIYIWNINIRFAACQMSVSVGLHAYQIFTSLPFLSRKRML
jgi:hypothetical protein